MTDLNCCICGKAIDKCAGSYGGNGKETYHTACAAKFKTMYFGAMQETTFLPGEKAGVIDMLVLKVGDQYLDLPPGSGVKASLVVSEEMWDELNQRFNVGMKGLDIEVTIKIKGAKNAGTDQT